ncbi:MAG: UTP--glucose-1-phosphate uridylyltransferase AglF [Wenzhouxiangellaceae bacterium]
MHLPHTAIILMAGRGTRLKPLTDSLPKVLVPVRGKALVEWIVDEVIAAGVKHLVMIIGYRGADIQQFFGDGSDRGVHIDYVVQQQLDGTGGALRSAAEYLSHDYAVIFGDSYFQADRVRQFIQQAPVNCLAVTRVEDPSRYGIVELDSHGQVLTLEEKPAQPKSNLAIAGMYKLTPLSRDYIQALNLSPRGEYELPSAVNAMIADGVVFHAHDIGEMRDVGTHEELQRLNQSDN